MKEEEILPNFNPFGKEEKGEEEIDKYIEDYINTSEEVINKLKPFMPKDYDDEDDDEGDEITKSLPEHIGEVIKHKNREISNLEEQKSKMVEKIIGQMYKGVLIPERITIRNGEVFRYRTRNWNLRAFQILKEIKNNLHEVASKLTDKNLEIIEFIFDKFNLENENENVFRNRRGEEEKVTEFDKLKLVDFSRGWNKSRYNFEIREINSLMIDNEGDVEFGLRNKQEEQPTRENLSNELHKLLCFKFHNQLKEMSNNFIKELDSEINTLKTDIEEIKSKGSNLLMIAEIQKGTENVKGWGN